MAKKEQERRAKKDEELDEDEQEHDEDEEEDEEEEAVSAKPVPSARTVAERKRPRPRREAKAHDDHDDDDHHEARDEDGGYEDDDPYWWTPHAVMSGLVVVGILGFFGIFNKVAATLMGHPAPTPVAEASATPSARADAKPMPPPGPPGAAAQQPNREMFGAKHLLVMYKGGRRAPPNVERTKEEAKTRAEEAAKKAKAPGAKFEELVKEYSDEPGAGARGGDLGKFPKGSMVPEFQAGLEKLKVGEVSGVVESPFGFHVILRTQ